MGYTDKIWNFSDPWAWKIYLNIIIDTDAFGRRVSKYALRTIRVRVNRIFDGQSTTEVRGRTAVFPTDINGSSIYPVSYAACSLSVAPPRDWRDPPLASRFRLLPSPPVIGCATGQCAHEPHGDETPRSGRYVARLWRYAGSINKARRPGKIIRGKASCR